MTNLFSTEEAAVRVGYHGQRIGKSFTDVAVKRLNFSPVETRKAKNGREQYFWTQEQIDAVVTYRNARRKSATNGDVPADNLFESAATDNKPAQIVDIADDTTTATVIAASMDALNDDFDSENAQLPDAGNLTSSEGTADVELTPLELTPDNPPPVVGEESITLADRAARIRSLCTVGRNVVIAIGRELIAAKKEVEHGQWGTWLKNEFSAEYGLTERTAQNYMRLAERYGKTKTFSDLPTSTLIQMLALPKGAEQTFVDEQAAAGRPIETQSAREVQRNVKEFKERTTEDRAADETEIDGERIDVGASKIKGIVAVDDDTAIDDRDIKSENVFGFEADASSATINIENYRLFDAEQIVAVRTLITSTNDLQTVKEIQTLLLELDKEITKIIVLAENRIDELSDVAD